MQLAPVKTRLLSILVVLLLAAVAGCMRSDADKWHVIQERIITAKSLTLFRGIPHPLFDSAGNHQARNSSVQAVPGGIAYPDPLTITSESQELLTQTVLAIPTLKKYGGPYKDGGFWPAHAVRWENPNGSVVISFDAANCVVEIESGQIRLRGELANGKDREAIETIFTTAEDTRTQQLIRGVYGPATK